MKSKLFKHLNLPEMYNIEVGEGNKIYVEVSGNKSGIPVIFCHGGPGGHCRNEHHSLFDPKIFKSIIFDQRGCGKSTPYRSLSGNDTSNLVEDIEKIREFLNIKKFLIVGGSWGATLALKYAIKYTKNISAILLRSVFLGTMREIQWAFDDGPKIFAPKLHQDFMGKVDKGEKFVDFYYQKIVKKDSKLHSWLWHDYERILSQINPENSNFEDFKTIVKRQGLPNSPFMELHYIKNNFFMEEDYIVKSAKVLNNIPGLIVQGRYDLICPPNNAYQLHKNWKKSKLTIINTAGHSSSDEGILENMIEGLEILAKAI